MKTASEHSRYSKTVQAYQYLSGLRKELDNHFKKPLFERAGFGWESDYYLDRLRKFLDATELLLSLDKEMKQRLEKQFKLESFDSRLTQLVLENSC